MVVAKAPVTTATRTQVAMEAVATTVVVVTCAAADHTAITQTSPNIAMTQTDGHTIKCNQMRMEIGRTITDVSLDVTSNLRIR